MRKKSAVLLVCLLGVVLSITLLSSSSIAKEKKVFFLTLADLTGPAAGLSTPIDCAVRDYFKSVNEGGGVDGIEIDVIGVDSRYDTARAVSAYKRYRKRPKLLLTMSSSSGMGDAIQPMIERDKSMFLAPGSGERQGHLRRGFCFYGPYQDTFGAAVDWLMEDWKTKGKSGKPVLGYIAFDNAWGHEVMRGGKEYAESKGIKLLPPELFTPGTLKFDVYLTRLAKGGADYIYVEVCDPTPTYITRDAHALGLTKKIQMIHGPWGATKLGIESHPEALEGTVVVSWVLRGPEAEEHPLLHDLAIKHRGSLDYVTTGYTVGVGIAIFFEGALRKALADVGYEKINGQAMYEAYQKITGLENGGISGPCAYGPNSRRGTDTVKFYRIKGGKAVPLSDWTKSPDTISYHKNW